MQGGLHVPLEATTQIEIVDEDDGGKPQPPKPPRDRRKPAPAPIATVWMSHESEEAWEANTPGDVERVPISTFAEVGDEYKDFADAEGDGLLIKLNEEFAPLKSYVSMRAQSIGDEGVARLKDRYALGLGVYMVVADERHRRLGESGEPPDEELVGASLQAAAQGVLAMLPEFDALIAEAGLDGV